MNNPYSIHPPLSNLQVELLKLFSTDVPDNDLAEIKNMIARFLLDKARDNSDAIWVEKGYTDEVLQQIIIKNYAKD